MKVMILPLCLLSVPPTLTPTTLVATQPAKPRLNRILTRGEFNLAVTLLQSPIPFVRTLVKEERALQPWTKS